VRGRHCFLKNGPEGKSVNAGERREEVGGTFASPTSVLNLGETLKITTMVFDQDPYITQTIAINARGIGKPWQTKRVNSIQRATHVQGVCLNVFSIANNVLLR